jgi:ABC-type polysaccharide/polyol phosphate transport system ATPase subunit
VPVLELQGVAKAFRVRHNPARDLKVQVLALVHPRHRERAEELWALCNVTLAVEAGQTLGVIGPNGSGKSTLLRVMAGIFPPTRGALRVSGSVAPMIELGAGFEPELTGRENVYLHTSLFGLGRRETDALYDPVVAFAELDEFMDVPVKNYSTGMSMRLAFALAAHLSADVLLVDEVLAVGDQAFQQKCLARMAEVRARGCAIVLVSHDAGLVQRTCDRACLLVRGAVFAEGEPGPVLARYGELMAAAAHGD